MRKITRDAVQAFRNNEKFSRGNTQVVPGSQGTSMYLHGHEIASSHAGEVAVNACGYETVTTKERLNGLLSACGCQGIYQKNFIWYWQDGTEFNTGWQPAPAI